MRRFLIWLWRALNPWQSNMLVWLSGGAPRSLDPEPLLTEGRRPAIAWLFVAIAGGGVLWSWTEHLNDAVMIEPLRVLLIVVLLCGLTWAVTSSFRLDTIALRMRTHLVVSLLGISGALYLASNSSTPILELATTFPPTLTGYVVLVVALHLIVTLVRLAFFPVAAEEADDAFSPAERVAPLLD